MARRVIIVLGPTAVGKTDYSISLAQKYSSPIISCDSRQIYREMRIGTAVPDRDQLEAVRHYFIQDHSVTVPYTAGTYESEALDLVHRLFDEGHETLIMSGGSMFYVDAFCKGLSQVPETDPQLRRQLTERLASEGVASLAEELRTLDPEAWKSIDLSNGARVMRAMEVRMTTGRSFTYFRQAEPKQRDFEIEKIGLIRPKAELHARINARVDKMVAEGLIDEVRSLTQFRNLTALQTVGYKEVFDYLDNPDTISLEQTVSSICTHTRQYAKRQLTWWRRDEQIRWINL